MASQVRHVRTASRRALGSICALALVVSLAAAFAGRASATTSPGSIYQVNVTITDSGVVFVPHERTGKVAIQYIRADGRSAAFPRGVLIHFLFTNEGTKTYVGAVRFTNKRQANPLQQIPTLSLANKAAPGHHSSLFGTFNFRGSFVVEALLNKKPLGRLAYVTIY
jgi:hypothetical protein